MPFSQNSFTSPLFQLTQHYVI